MYTTTLPVLLLKHLIYCYKYNMSRVVRKRDYCLCENKGADQLRSNCEADQRLCFRYTDSTIFQIRNFKLLACFCSCTARFVSDLVGNPEDRFSRVAAHMMSLSLGLCELFWLLLVTKGIESIDRSCICT